jgi:hypothetical protein
MDRYKAYCLINENYEYITVLGSNGLYSVFGKSLCTYKRGWKTPERTIVSKN